MERSFWDRVEELKESINGGVEPMEYIRLPTKTIKLALGMYLVQSGFIALWWAISTSTFYPLLIPISSFLQVGWFWNKVTASWKAAKGMNGYSQLDGDVELEESDYEPMFAPNVEVQTGGITKQDSQTIPVDLELGRNALGDSNV